MRVLKVYTEDVDAFRMRLRSFGIESTSLEENAPGVLLEGFAGPVRVIVDDSQYAKAKAILAEMTRFPSRFVCPRCKSENSRLTTESRLTILFSALLWFIPLAFLPLSRQCRQCAFVWTFGNNQESQQNSARYRRIAPKRENDVRETK